MVFIAYNYNGVPISIVNAVSREIATAYWHGADIIPHSIKSLREDFTPLSEHPTGVYPIMKTLEVTASSVRFEMKSDAVLITVHKP